MTLEHRTRFWAALFATVGLCFMAFFLTVVHERAKAEEQLMALQEAAARTTGLRLAAAQFALGGKVEDIQDAKARILEIHLLLDYLEAGHSGVLIDSEQWQRAREDLAALEKQLARQDTAHSPAPTTEKQALLTGSASLGQSLTKLRAPWSRALERWDFMASVMLYAFAALFFGLIALSAGLLRRHVLHPLGQLIHSMALVGKGDLGVRVGISRTDEIGALAQAFDGMLDRLQESTVLRTRLEKEVLERQQAEGALLESEQRLHLALSAAGAGIWDWALVSGKLAWSSECFELYGIEPSGGAPDFAGWLNLLHDEDRARVQAAIDHVLSGDSPWNIEFRVMHPAKGLRWLLSLGSIEYGADGALLALSGIHLDITERKGIELQLRLLGQVFAQAPVGIVVTDRENHIVTVNGTFSALTGYGAAEVLGHNPSLLGSGRTTAEDYSGLWEAIHQKGYWEGELWDKKKDGTCYPQWLRVSVLKDEQGNISHHVGHFSDITERKAAEVQIHHLAHHDALTGLLNRLSLRLCLDQALSLARRTGEQLAVMFIDLDRFKAINDSQGHDIGDRVLVEVGKRLRGCVRDSDLVARLGGDEFVVVILGMTEGVAEHAATKANRMVRRLSKAYTFESRVLKTTPSIGISLFPTDGGEADTLMKNADTAMYHAKARGRNNFQFFSVEMNRAVIERMELEQALREAGPRKEFFLHFQPQLRAHDSRVVGFEALARWQHPLLGHISPCRFIPVAEETGVIDSLGLWVLENACDQLWHLKRQGWETPRMTVNLSLRQLADPALMGFLSRCVRAYELGPDELELEITESTAMDDPEATILILKQIRSMGIALAIDDFGTGYSSLAYLKRLPIQRLKLDRSFVQDIETDPNDAHICRATISLAHSLGLDVVAEGVETKAQLDYLTSLGCDVIQGYYFSRPLPPREAEQFLARHRAVPVYAPVSVPGQLQ